jgi:chromosome segregation ATPase
VTNNDQQRKQEALEAYRQAVIEPGLIGDDELPGILRDSWKTTRQLRADRSTWRARRRAHRELFVDVPKLEAQLEEAKQRERDAEPQSLADKPLSEFGTIGELATAVSSVQLERDRETLVTRWKQERKRLRNQIRGTRTNATQVLLATCDPALQAACESIGRKITDHKTRIRELQPFVDAPKKVAELQARLEELEGPLPEGAYTPKESQEARHSSKRTIKRRLAEQRELAKRADDARGAVEEAQAAIRALEAEQREVREQQLKPENMKWATG